MRVILVQPRSELNVSLWGKLYMMSGTLPVVAATVPAETEVIIVDENVQPVPWELMNQGVLVGITAMTHTAQRAYEIGDRARQLGSQVILGGIHPTVMLDVNPDEIYQHADSVVWGEVDWLWKEILVDAEAGRLKRVYRHQQPPNIAHLPPPRWDLIDHTRYWQWSVSHFSRGCPHNCSFCTATAVFGKKVRFRAVDEVVAEIKLMQIRGARTIFLADDNIGADPHRLRELCEKLVPLKVKWISQCHAKLAENEELLALLERSGCVCLLVGFESLALSQRVSRKNKNVDVVEAVAAFHRHHILLIGCFICGLPGQDTDYQRMVQFILREIDIPQVSVHTAFPGTKDFTEAEKAGKFLGRPWSDFTVARVVSQLGQAAATLRQDYDQLSRRVYAPWQVARRSLRAWLSHDLYHGYVTLVINLVYRQLVGFRDQPAG